MDGTDLAYVPCRGRGDAVAWRGGRGRNRHHTVAPPPVLRRVRYWHSGPRSRTESGRCSAMSGTDLGYGATRADETAVVAQDSTAVEGTLWSYARAT
eukprot:3938106-Rhodomonas_salina.4